MSNNNIFVCPTCEQSNATLLASSILVSDVRMDQMRCNSCGTEWRTYSHIDEMSREILHVPQTSQDNLVIEVAENNTDE